MDAWEKVVIIYCILIIDRFLNILVNFVEFVTSSLEVTKRPSYFICEPTFIFNL